MCYVNLRVTTKQKLTEDTRKIKRGESKHATRENHQITKEDSRRCRKQQANYKIIFKKPNKMTLVCPYLSTFTLNVNGLNSSIKRHPMAEGVDYKRFTHQL